jgi:hypothetical protein
LAVVGGTRRTRQSCAAIQADAQAQRHRFPRKAFQQVAHGQSKFGISGQHQATLEEQGIGIFQATSQQQQVGGGAAHTGFGRLIADHQPIVLALDHPSQVQVGDFDAQSSSLHEFKFASGQRRRQHPRHRPFQQLSAQVLGHQPQQGRQPGGRRQAAQQPLAARSGRCRCRSV